jgi:cytochrome P450
MMYLTQPEEFLTSCHRKYGDVFAIETVIFGKEVCVVRPDVIKAIFTGDADELRAGEANVALQPLVGKKSVLLLDGPEHLRHRRLVMPPFHGERMLAYAEAMREITHRAMDAWPRGRAFVIHVEMQKITLEIILRTIFGADDALADALREKLVALLERLASPVSMLGTVPAMRHEVFGLSPWAQFQRAIRDVDDLIYKQIARHREELKSAGSRPPRTDVLSLLLAAKDEEGNGMSDVELRDELMTLLVAGHETTATELAWAFDSILRDRRVRTKVLDDIGERAQGDKNAPWDPSPMPYLDATIKEVMRLHPVIPAVGRCAKKDMTVGGFDVPKGTLVVPGVWLTHRLPDIYPEPDAFRPERFLDTKPDPYSFLPFGGGIRRCVGMAFALFEMKVVLTTVLSRVRLRPVEPEAARTSLRGFTHAPRGGVPVMLD